MKRLIQTLFFLLLVTQICFAQWVQVGLNDKSVKDIAVQNLNIFAVTSDSGKVYRSVDNGANWAIVVDSNAADIEIAQSGKVFMIQDSIPWGWSASLYSSLDNGNSWIWLNIMEQIADSFYFGHGNVGSNISISPAGIIFCHISYLVGHDGSGSALARSNDDGISWTTPGLSVLGGMLFDFRNQFVITIGYTYSGGGAESAIHLSSDGGNSWTYLGGTETGYFHALGLYSNGNIIVGGLLSWESRAIHISTDMCSTWTQISTLNSQVGVSWSSGSTEGMLIGTDSLGIFLFSDEGDSLGSRNEGLTNLNIQTLTLDNNGYVYAGTGNGVWRRPLTEVTPVEENQIPIPSSFNLSQNFPNPFNPSTKIKYSVPQSSHVVLKIFDVLGNEIETLVDEYKPAGRYEVEFNFSSLSGSVSAKGGYASGIYFYQLKAGNYIDTKKMILLK